MTEDQEEDEEEDEELVPIKVEFTTLSQVWDGRSSAAKPRNLDGKQLRKDRELIRLFENGWVKGHITKPLRNKNSNCEVHWADDPDGAVRNQLLCLSEYHPPRSKTQPVLGAWFFLE